MTRALNDDELKTWDWVSDFMEELSESDVAEWAELSISTVVRVVRNRNTPSRKTLNKLHQLAEDLIADERTNFPW